MDFLSDYLVEAIGQFLSVVGILIIFGILYCYRRLRGDNSDQAKTYANTRFARTIKILCLLLLAVMLTWVLVDTFAR